MGEVCEGGGEGSLKRNGFEGRRRRVGRNCYRCNRMEMMYRLCYNHKGLGFCCDYNVDYSSNLHHHQIIIVQYMEGIYKVLINLI